MHALSAKCVTDSLGAKIASVMRPTSGTHPDYSTGLRRAGADDTVEA